MVIAPAVLSMDVLLETLSNSRETVDRINKACAEKGLPPAFPADEEDTPQIPGNPDYRFAGLGLIVGLPPKFSFWVHYKPDSQEHVELGKFTISIGLGKFLSLQMRN